MALLVEGLGVGGETSIEEYIIGHANDISDGQDPTADKDKITLYGFEAGLCWVARPVKGQSALGSALALVSRHGSNRSMESHSNIPLMDPLVTLFGSVHEKLPETGGSLRSTMFPNFGSMFSMAGGQHPKTEEWDEENVQGEGEDYASDGEGGSDDNLHSPLLSRQATSMEVKDIVPPHAAHGSALGMRRNSSLMQGAAGDAASSMGIGEGWQLAWKWSEREGTDGQKEGGFQRIYLHQVVQASRRGSLVSLPGGDVPEESEYIQASALVSQSALYSKELKNQHPVGPAMVHPAESAAKGPRWGDLLEPGVRHALIVGIGIQLLQQSCLLDSYADKAFVQERTQEGGRSLRAMKIVKKCPKCPTDISVFLQNPQINTTMKAMLETCKQGVEEDSPEEVTGEGSV